MWDQVFFLKILLSCFPLHYPLVLAYCNHLNFPNQLRFTLISITQFIAIRINVVDSAGFRLQYVFFSFVFSTKE